MGVPASTEWEQGPPPGVLVEGRRGTGGGVFRQHRLPGKPATTWSLRLQVTPKTGHLEAESPVEDLGLGLNPGCALFCCVDLSKS